MSNSNLEIALRNSLDGIMTNSQINQAISGELKEVEVEKNYAGSVEKMSPPTHNKTFTASFNKQIEENGGVWLGNVWNLKGYELTGTLGMVATEECSAITNFGPTDKFDAAKGLTNILRMIKSSAY